MCGLLVVTHQTIDDIKLNQSFKKLHVRGPDMAKKVSFEHGVFCFQRLSIMDLNESGMQPFHYKNHMLVANAEIYNFESLLKTYVSHYEPQSKSDCEVLLPLYEVLKEGMFLKLDAEFAIVLYDANERTFIAARDSIGIRPLFYGYDTQTNDIVFSSDVKSMIDIVETVYPFPPGHYYKNQQFHQYTTLYQYQPTSDSIGQVIYITKQKFIEGVLKRLHADAPIGYLLSGGLDSSLVCAIASKHMKRPIQTFSIGMDKDAIDLKYAEQVASYLNTDHISVVMSKNEVIEHLEKVIMAIESYDVTTVRASIGMYMIAKYIHEHTSIKVLLTGEVSDELFGYKYTDYAPSAKAFQEESLKRIRELHQYDVLRADRCLAAHSLEARVPFADIDFMRYVLSIDPDLKMNTTGIGKYLLRKAFEGDYLPKEILYREKAAFSDAVGHSMVDDLKAYAASIYDDHTFEHKVLKYKVNTPKTKEALLYRELFDKHYQKHEHLIPGYWMPNASWEHCDVDDPSARVLKNYGKSGE